MPDNKKMQYTENTNEWNNLIEEKIITTTDITENVQFLSNKKFNDNSESQQEESSQLIRCYNKINLKEINPITISNEREKLLFEKVHQKNIIF
ncbi:kinase-like domain-containing protein [Rhizophagus irregularis DAOM 181602=DAOM 197198]|nr:kinase-like domain-containing protein [Rhizophagus irregularis DAOM 181602=DAOM 197198]